jgi:poly-gamma-glutamate capsule biosynthesis protein CapA/YwtB (metallophosphatase superfamily)
MSKSVKLKFFGDVSLIGDYLDPTRFAAYYASIKSAAGSLPEADLTIADWEAPIFSGARQLSQKELRINTNPQSAELATPLNLNLVTLANNHVFDFGEEGFRETTDFLNRNQISFVGTGLKADDASRPFLTEINGVPIALLGYVDPGTNPGVSGDGLFLNYLEPDRAIADVEELTRKGFVSIVVCHWGIDFLPLPLPERRELARNLITAGAALVVGHHPHRLQPYEKWNDGMIFYSLGDFLAGDIYPRPRFTEPTCALTCEVTDSGVKSFELRPFILRKGVISADKTGKVEKAFDRLNSVIKLDETNYRKAFARALMRHVFLVKPLHFLLRKKNPIELLKSLRKRHWRENIQLLRSIIGKAPDGGRS